MYIYIYTLTQPEYWNHLYVYTYIGYRYMYIGSSIQVVSVSLCGTSQGMRTVHTVCPFPFFFPFDFISLPGREYLEIPRVWAM